MEFDIQKACRTGDTTLIRALVEKTPEILNENDPKLGWTPLYRTVVCSHLEATNYLLAAGANPNIKNRMGECPIHQAADNKEC
jgi:ankyrin repeat protein